MSLRNRDLRDVRFTMLVNEDEMELIEQIATRSRRSKSDAIRQLIYQEAERLGLDMNEDRYLSKDKRKGPRLENW